MFKRVPLFICVLFILIMSGCAGMGTEGFLNPDCGPDTDMTFKDWRSWNKVNPTVLLSKGHGDVYVDIYVDDLAKGTYLSASSPYPKCSRITKVQYTDKTATEIEELGFMVKMSEGYDPEYNDWWYARYDATGTKVIDSGKMVTVCRTCHEQASKNDYLFSEKVIAAASK
jgi:nucleoside-diphosphate-sugar epimerase